MACLRKFGTEPKMLVIGARTLRAPVRFRSGEHPVSPNGTSESEEYDQIHELIVPRAVTHQGLNYGKFGRTVANDIAD